jgi:hypothetical protein
MIAFAQVALQNLSVHIIAIGAIGGVEILVHGDLRGGCHVFSIVR